MFQRLKKNEKGLTLIELLVVIVILGIIAAIAILAIGGIIDNSKKDAHIANAQQMANAAKLYVASENDPTNAGSVTLKQLIDGNYMDAIKDPSNGDAKYDDASVVTITHEAIKDKDGKDTTTKTYVYKVSLYKSGTTESYVATDINALDLKRGNVTLK